MIPVCEPTLEGNEKKYVMDCMETGWISSSGKYIDLFEKTFSKFCQVKQGVACSNGTTAIHLALEAAGIGRGDEVIIPTFTMIATANAIIYSGARPVLIDAEKETWNIDVTKIKEKITSKTRAIIPVHTYGHPVDMDPVMELAKERDLIVIEDAAEAHGAEYKGRRTGSLGHIGCFSFYANKIITTGEGGMIVTNDEEIAERARLLRNHAFTEPRFMHKELGFNYRMTNIQAAIGVAQMEYADTLVQRRIHNTQRYNSLLKEIPGITLPPKKDWAKNVYWMYGVLIEKEFGISAAQVREKLGKKEIDTRSFFLPMHRQPLYAKKDERFPDTNGVFPIAEELWKKGVYLPSSSHLAEQEIKRIAETLAQLK